MSHAAAVSSSLLKSKVYSHINFPAILSVTSPIDPARAKCQFLVGELNIDMVAFASVLPVAVGEIVVMSDGEVLPALGIVVVRTSHTSNVGL